MDQFHLPLNRISKSLLPSMFHFFLHFLLSISSSQVSPPRNTLFQFLYPNASPAPQLPVPTIFPNPNSHQLTISQLPIPNSRQLPDSHQLYNSQTPITSSSQRLPNSKFPSASPLLRPTSFPQDILEQRSTKPGPSTLLLASNETTQ